MNYFYATRRDKQGNKLVTSYEKQAQATKYGGPTATVTKELYHLDENGTPSKEDTGTGLILRSKLEGTPKADASADSAGRFVLYRQDGDKFVATNFRFATYGNANNGMKSLVNTFGTLLVVEETSTDAPAKRWDAEDEFFHDAPF